MLKGYAIGEDKFLVLINGGQYKGNGVVKDGNIITSGICPNLARDNKGKDGTPELIEAFGQLMKESRTKERAQVIH